MLPLRPYQETDATNVRLAMRDYRAVLLVEPTGAGKGFLCAYIIHGAIAKGNRVIFLVNRRNLVRDMSERLTRPGIQHGVYMGGVKSKPWLPVHVASIDTLHRRAHLPAADLLIVDEAHFSNSPTFRSVVDRYPDAKVLGLTATPIRADGQGLGRLFGGLFDVMVIGPSVSELIEQKYLVPSVVYSPEGIDTSSITAPKKGDWTDAQSAQICNTGKLVGDLVKTWKNKASDRKTVVFGSDQAHAIRIAEQFRAAGVDWAYVDCNTTDKDRDTIWRDYDHGRLAGISSVGVISYGWDHPICSCVILARITNFLGLHLQMLGRGSRPHPGKQDFMVLDHAGNSNRLDARYEDDRMWSLDGTTKKVRDTEPAMRTCKFCFYCFRGYPKNCPGCGREIEKNEKPVIQVAGELTKFRERKTLTATEWQRKEATPEDRARRFVEYQRTEYMRGYKHGWAEAKYRAIFQEEPPGEELLTAVGVQLGMF